MESEVIKKFNSELSSIHVSKVPSKTKILEITRAALKAKSLYKHVVFSIEKFILKCKPEHRLHVLYVIDSIIRASKHQFKHKDVYAARFLSHFDQILRILLNCKSSEKLKVVRTLNLWLANGVYQKEQIDHYREMFRKTGIDIDFESIEKAVKGEGADMRIYGGFYLKKSNTAINQKSTTPPFPPPQDGILGARPGETMGSSQNIGMTDVFKFQPSENIVDGTISQKEMLDLINRVGFDTTATFGKDPELLSKAHQLFVDSLKPRILLQNQQFENERKMKGNSIKKVLTTEFDYSDDEDEKDKEAEEEKEEPVKTMTHEEIFEMANGLIKNPNVVAALKTMADERIIAFNNASNLIRNQVAAGHHAAPPTTSAAPSLNSQSQSNIMNLAAAAAAAAGQPNLATLQHLHSLNPQLLQNAQMNPAMQQALQSGRLAQLPPANSLNLAQLNALRGVGQAHQNNLLGFLGANPLLGIGGLGGAPPNDLVKQLSNMTQGGAQSHPFGVPPPALMHQHQQMPPGHGNNLVTSAQQQQLQFLENELEQSENDGKDDRKDRRTRERERSKERERRKQGLPSIKPGITYIASRTLWLKKVPQNCTESDLKIAVESCGETAGIRIIQSRACAFVTMESRKAAYDVINRLKEVTIAKKEFKVYWARLQGMTEERYVDMFDSERGVVGIPHDQLPANLEKFCEGAVLDIDSLPDDKKSMYKETGELILNSMNSRSMTMPGLPPGIPPQFSFNGLPIGNLPPPPGAYQPQQLKSGMMPPPPPQYASISGFQPLPPGVGPPLPSIQQGGGNPLAPPNFDPNKPPPPPSLMGHHFGGGGGPPTTPGNAVGAMMGANAYSARGGFRGGGGAGGFRGGRGGGGFENGRGGYRNDQAAPSRAGRGEGGRFEERRDHGGDRGWQRDRERSTNDRRSGRYEEERRRYSRWNRDDESDGGRRERKSSSERGGERRRDRDGSPDHRRNRETRRTPPHPDNDYQLKRNDGNVGEKNGVDDETVSSTTLDDGKLPPPTGVETEALKNNEAVINAHQENVDEVPMDLE